MDDNTQIVSSSGNTSDFSAIREGTPVRATFDPASNRAEKIEVMGKASKRSMHKKSASSGDTSSMGSEADSKAKTPNPNDAKSEPQDTTGKPSPTDQK